MPTFYTDRATAPKALPDGTGAGCRSELDSFCCTLDRGHEGRHIADGISTRCAEWDDDEADE